MREAPTTSRIAISNTIHQYYEHNTDANNNLEEVGRPDTLQRLLGSVVDTNGSWEIGSFLDWLLDVPPYTYVSRLMPPYVMDLRLSISIS